MKKVKEKEAPDLSSLLVFGYACKLFRCYYNNLYLHQLLCFLASECQTVMCLCSVNQGPNTERQQTRQLVHGSCNYYWLVILGKFRDDERALSIEGGNSLIPWMGDPSLRIDRCWLIMILHCFC